MKMGELLVLDQPGLYENVSTNKYQFFKLSLMPSWNSNRANIMCMFNRIYTHLCFFPFLSSFFVILLIMNKSNTHQDTPPYTSKKTGKQCAVHGCQNCYFKDKGLSAGYYIIFSVFQPKPRPEIAGVTS